MASQVQPRRSTTVCDDWRAWLPAHKDKLFRAHLQEFETSYGMFSVSLDEAIKFHNCGLFPKSCQIVRVTPTLCGRLAASLWAVLHTMGEHAKHYGTVPNAAPLNAANFRGAREQRAAKLNSLMSHVLLTQRAHFLRKIHILEEMVEDLQQTYCSAVEELASGFSTTPGSQWHTLDSAHFDLNTCLRETIVILKSFFVILPDDEIQPFEECVCTLQRKHSRQTFVAAGAARWAQRRRTTQFVEK